MAPHTPAFQTAILASQFVTGRQTPGTLSAPTTSLRPAVPHRAAQRPARASPCMKVYDVEVTLLGEKHMIPIDEDMTILEGIEEHGLEVLYSCRAGVCVTCAAKIHEGKIDPGFASITEDLKNEGYVLCCSAYPRSDGIKLEMNKFDEAYEKQYGKHEQGKN